MNKDRFTELSNTALLEKTAVCTCDKEAVERSLTNLRLSIKELWKAIGILKKENKKITRYIICQKSD